MISTHDVRRRVIAEYEIRTGVAPSEARINQVISHCEGKTGVALVEQLAIERSADFPIKRGVAAAVIPE